MSRAMHSKKVKDDMYRLDRQSFASRYSKNSYRYRAVLFKNKSSIGKKYLPKEEDHDNR